MELMRRSQLLRMSKGQKLRALVNERLTAVAQDIFELFERTIAEYEEEVLWPKQQQKREPAVQLSAVSPKAAGQREATELIYIKEEPEPELCIKREDEDLQPPFTVAHNQDASSEIYQNPSEENMTKTFEDRNELIDSSSDIDSENGYLKWGLHSNTSNEQMKTEGCNSYPIHVIHSNIDRAARTTSPFSNSKCMYEAEGLENNKKITDSGSDAGAKRKLHQCSQCGKAYQHRPSLHRHILIHKEQKPFKCSVCQKGFSQKPHLTSHMRIHTGEKPFSCPFCAKSFTNQSNVRQHLRVHTGEKPFVCSVCNVQFRCTKSLQTHMRIHTGEKPFGCPECGKRFKQQSSFIGHMRSHRGEKPFCCTVCDRCFSQRTNLKNHMKSHNVQGMTKVDGDVVVEQDSGQSQSATSEDYITTSI